MSKSNNYFSLESPAGQHYFTFDDRSDADTRRAYVAMRRVVEQFGIDEASFSCFRPIVWRIETEMGVIGRLKSIRHAPDPTVRGSMRLFCSLCGVSSVVRDVNVFQRDRQAEVFEETHAQHWIDEQLRLETVRKAYAARHASKKKEAA